MYHAYMTVEASFIIPVCVFLILLLLYFGFFCYEKVVALQCCYLAALRGSNEWNLSGAELDHYIEKELNVLLKEKNLYQMETEYQIHSGMIGIEVSVNEKIEIPFSEIRGNGINGWDLNSKKNAYRNKPASFIRKIRLLGK